jgi:hypothetical protein
MQSLRRHHHAFVRLALIAMLALACVPTLSRWLAAAEGPLAWAQVCTPQGMRSLGDGPAAPVVAQHLDACGFCTLAAGPVPPVAALVWQDRQPGQPLPRPAAAASRGLPAWSLARPRAPPSVA